MQKLLSKDGYFVLCDMFNKEELPELEELLQKYFIIDKKEVITVNVKHAMSLDK